MKDLKKNFWPFFSILFIVLVFFWKVIFKGMVPLPADFIVGVYYPWLDYKWGYPAGVPVKNPITTDVVSFIYPMQTHAVGLIKNLKLPLWNPYILAGTPLLANFQSAPFSPTNFVYFLFDKITAWSIQVVLQHFLAAFFAYFLLRYWKVSKTGSIFGGIIFAFSGFNVIWSQWNGHALSASFIPLILLFEDKWLKIGKLKDGLLISILLVLQILSGYPQVVLYTLLAVGILYLSRINETQKLVFKTILLFLFGIFALGLASFQILPGAELLTLSQRTIEPHPFEWAFLPWQKVITFIAPDFFGNHATQDYWGPQDYTSNTGFVGVVAAVLGVLGASLLRKKKEVIYCFIVLIVSLLFAFPTPISIFLWKSGFLGFNAASAHRSLVLFNLAIGLLAAFGYDSLQSKIKFRYRVIAVFTTALILFGFGFYAYSINQTVGLENLILPTLILFFTSFIILVKPNFRLVLALLSIVELFYFSWKFTPFSPRSLVFPKTPVIEYLEKQEKPFRVVADKVIPINFLMTYGIETIEGYDAVYPQRVSEFVAAINGNYGSLNSNRRYGIIDDYNSRLLTLANAKYFVILKKDMNDYIENQNFRVSFEDKSVAVLENRSVLPRSFFVDKWEVIKGNKDIIDRLLDPSFDFSKKIILEEEPPRGIKGFIFTSDTFYPGWKAFIDGKEAKIYRADFTFRAVPVPSSESKVEYKYQPVSFYQGVKISIFSALVILGMIGYTLFKRKNYAKK